MSRSSITAFMLVCVVGASACRDRAKSDPSLSQSGSAAALAPPPPPPPVKTPLDEILERKTMAEALAYAKPRMKDATNDLDPGTLIFGAWASKNMKWTDVAVAKDETTPELVLKDPDEERGKRVCFTGKIVQISVEKTDVGKFNVGIMMVGYYSVTLFHFLNVGSSGSIVEKTQARLCGVVTGKYTYSNSGGGTGHSIQIVGMWDLPENKPKDAGVP